jgi:hypothetical protein
MPLLEAVAHQPCLHAAASSDCALYSTRQGDTFVQDFNVSLAHAVVLSRWQSVHGFGTFSWSVVVGVMNANV